MLTKKQLIERLACVPDDALIGAVQRMGRVEYGAYWGDNHNMSFILDLMVGAAYVPLTNKFDIEMLKK
jgi:hypothetical protein